MDGRLLGRLRSCSGNAQEWNAVKFDFKSYVGVVAPSILTAVDRAEPMSDPQAVDGLSEEDGHITRSLSFLLARVLPGPTLQIVMNVGEQNGLESWRLLVRADQPVTGANRIAPMQSIHSAVQALSRLWQTGRRAESVRWSGENVSCDLWRRGTPLGHADGHQIAVACGGQTSSGAATFRENR